MQLAFHLICVVAFGCLDASPVKVSRPHAITAANLTDEQAQELLQLNPSRPSILRPNDQFISPFSPLYLPDPERNKSNENIHLLATYSDEMQDKPMKLTLDTFIRPPPLPSFSAPINQQVQHSKDKLSYSYNNRFDYYFPVHVIDDSNEKYNDVERKMMVLQPPTLNNDPDYYAIKPKKLPKKYQPNKKDVGHSKSIDNHLIPIDNDGLILSEPSSFVTSQPVERFAPAPTVHIFNDDDLNTGEYIPSHELITESIAMPESTASIVTADSKSNAKIKSARNVNFELSNEKMTAA